MIGFDGDVTTSTSTCLEYRGEAEGDRMDICVGCGEFIEWRKLREASGSAANSESFSSWDDVGRKGGVGEM
jgi:hypothetical protein